eukprot:TRINITY_DN1443_c1_g1_i2.p1 TRINITY_DN1443_c1_g1~~TRINITY_DN1443_c1_g1_i2.p1  ORF type:complete len:241 (+),score=66.59 TRINITY_DN1443_c1_g1_i2:110-832(+)
MAESDLLFMENEHFALVDALPYIDTQLGSTEVAQQVKFLIEEEMGNFEARDYLASLPAPELSLLEGPSYQQEFQRVSMRAPLAAIDVKKYEVMKPEGGKAQDEEEWKKATAVAHKQLEYNRLRFLNLELLDQWGKKAWIAHTMVIRGAEKVLTDEATNLRGLREEVNKKRKLDQVSCGNELRKLTRELEQYSQDNDSVQAAVQDMELQVKRLREAAADRGVDISDVDPDAEKPSEKPAEE